MPSVEKQSHLPPDWERPQSLSSLPKDSQHTFARSTIAQWGLT